MKKFSIILLLGITVFLLSACEKAAADVMKSQQDKPSIEVKKETEEERSQREKQEADQKEEVLSSALERADQMAVAYDYEGAMTELGALPKEFSENTLVLEAQARYEAGVAAMIPYEELVPHVFFHSLIVDTARAFDGDSMAEGYNFWMTTLDEFNRMMQQMYDRNYVLIDIYEIVNTVIDDNDNGNEVLERAYPLIPEGKIPFILSVDNVNYPSYMEQDGFASRLVLDENGEVKNLYIDSEGNEMVGDYDVMPALDTFIKEHPDFSLRGARGIIAENGQEGALGYRTQLSDSPTYKEDVEMVKKIADKLKEGGWRFASHGYWHLHSNEISYEKLVEDTQRWHDEVQPLVGDTDLYIYPFGEVVKDDSEKMTYLKSMGFRVFGGVEVNSYMKVLPGHITQSRRNLDGFNMNNKADKLADMMDVEAVWDKSRPEF